MQLICSNCVKNDELPISFVCFSSFISCLYLVQLREVILLRTKLLRVERAPRTSGLGMSMLVSMLATESGFFWPELGLLNCKCFLGYKGERRGASGRGPKSLEAHCASLGRRLRELFTVTSWLHSSVAFLSQQIACSEVMTASEGHWSDC